MLKSSRSLVLRDDCISMQKEVVGLVFLSVLPGFFVEHVDISDEDRDSSHLCRALPSVAREAQSVIAESEQKLGEAGGALCVWWRWRVKNRIEAGSLYVFS